jgi:Flp pilus assembly protein protease CpaA
MEGAGTAELLAVVFCLRAVYTDLRTHKVENAWILCCLFLAAAYRICRIREDGPAGICDAGIGGMLPLLFLGFFFQIGAIGAGDLKLLAVLGILFGRSGIRQCMVRTFLAAAAAALFRMVRPLSEAVKETGKSRKEIFGAERCRYLAEYFRTAADRKKTGLYRGSGFHREHMHMTVYILAAVCMRIFAG